MPFLKIADPKKRDFIIERFPKTKQNVTKNVLSECMGESQYELSKLFKPITDTQKELKESDIQSNSIQFVYLVKHIHIMG